MRTEGGRLYITSQRAKVYNVTDSQASSPRDFDPGGGSGQRVEGGRYLGSKTLFRYGDTR